MLPALVTFQILYEFLRACHSGAVDENFYEWVYQGRKVSEMKNKNIREVSRDRAVTS